MSEERYRLLDDGFAAVIWSLLFFMLTLAALERCSMSNDIDHIIELLESPPAVLDAKDEEPA